MSYNVQATNSQIPTLLDYLNTKKSTESLYNSSGTTSGTNDVWNFFSEQCDIKVSMSFEKISEQLVFDLAAETADYLVDKPELADDYVLVVVEDPVQGRQIKAFHREDLVKDLEGEEKERALEALKTNTLISAESLGELPEETDDPELLGLAAKAQAFLDKNEDLLNILNREGYLPWSA